jgi:hypothetical protein
MAAAQHKLSRREVLAAACAVPFARHCERSEAIQSALPSGEGAGLPRRSAPRNDGKWQKALARFVRAEAGLEAVAHVDEDGPYDRALGRLNAALARLLRTPAPDLEAAAGKLDLIMRYEVFELSFGEASLAALRRDLRRFAFGRSPEPGRPS